MKNRKFVKGSITLLAPLVLAVGVFFGVKSNKVEQAEGYSTSSLPTTIKLNDTTPENIRSYYSSLNSLSLSERQGTNLLKNLKPILKNNQKYYAYDGTNEGKKIWQMYEIVDRDWTKSPASDLSGFDSSTNTITGYSYGTSYSDPGTNPYLHALYVNRETTNEMRAWKYSGQATVNHGGNAFWCIDREHIWPKSQGFNASGNGGARGDPMHLWPGDSDVNSSIHNNNFYGFVDTSSGDTTKGKWEYATENYLGPSLTLNNSNKVFEPQDDDKGDIARAIFYMVARYNYYSGKDTDSIDQNNPNLELVQNNNAVSSYTSNESTTGKMGILTDLLEWHHLDPVDSFEIHRNNLLFENYTNNRNPFVDFPEWVDFIWGKATYNGKNYQSYSSTPTGYAAPSTDTINGYNSGDTPAEDIPVTSVSLNKNSTTISVNTTETLSVTVSPSNATDSSVAWSSSNTSVATVDYAGVVTGVGTGSATITVRSNSDPTKSATCSVTVTNDVVNVTSISLDEDSLSVLLNETSTLNATVLPSDATNKSVTWDSSNTSIATVSEGEVNGVGAGTCTITVRSVQNPSVTATCSVTVVGADYTLNYSKSPFSSTTASSTVQSVTVDNITYENVYGKKYATNSTLEFNKNTSAYLGNTTAYPRPIKQIVLKWHKYEDADHIAVYEGTTALPSTNLIDGDSDDLITTYSFETETNYFFKIQVILTTYYVELDEINIYLEATNPVKTSEYSLIKNVDDLRTGDKIVFVGIRSSTYYAATALTSGHYENEATTYDNKVVTIGSSAIQFKVIRNNGLFSFENNGNYVAAKSKSSTTTSEESTITDSSRFTLSINASSGGITMTGQDSNATYNVFRFNGTNKFFTFYTSSTASSYSNVYIYKQKIHVLADNWSKTFLSSTSDGNKCTIDNWDDLSTSFKALDSKVRKEIATVEASASTDYSYRAQAMARYDYFMSDERFNKVEHFITGRASSSSARSIDSIQMQSDNVTIIVVLVSIISVSSLGCLCIVKKKRAGLR